MPDVPMECFFDERIHTWKKQVPCVLVISLWKKELSIFVHIYVFIVYTTFSSVNFILSIQHCIEYSIHKKHFATNKKKKINMKFGDGQQ
jgi:NADH:ubiquinone oxidoreductase subunit 4 (subunit M)